MNRRTFLSALIPAAVAAVGAARGMMRAKPTMAETGTPSALPTEIESQDLGTVSYTMKTGSAKVSILDPQLGTKSEFVGFNKYIESTLQNRKLSDRNYFKTVDDFEFRYDPVGGWQSFGHTFVKIKTD